LIENILIPIEIKKLCQQIAEISSSVWFENLKQKKNSEIKFNKYWFSRNILPFLGSKFVKKRNLKWKDEELTNFPNSSFPQYRAAEYKQFEFENILLTKNSIVEFNDNYWIISHILVFDTPIPSFKIIAHESKLLEYDNFGIYITKNIEYTLLDLDLPFKIIFSMKRQNNTFYIPS
jgi:hypothetical protein